MFLPSIIHGSLIESVYRYTRRRLPVTIRSQFRACILNFTRAFSAFSFDNFSGNVHTDLCVTYGIERRYERREKYHENARFVNIQFEDNCTFVYRPRNIPFSFIIDLQSNSYRLVPERILLQLFLSPVNNYVQCNTRIKRNRKPRSGREDWGCNYYLATCRCDVIGA